MTVIRRFESIDSALYTITQIVSSTVTYIGENETQGEALTTATWRVRRLFTQGSTVTTQFAGTGQFDQQFDDPDSLFPAPSALLTDSILLDGLTGDINFGNNYAFSPSTAFSIGMWIKPQNIASNSIICSFAGPGPNVDGYMFRWNSGTGSIFAQMRSSTDRNHTFDVAVSAGSWQSILFTFDGGGNINGLDVYVDNTKATTPPSGGLGGAWDVGQDFIIGQRNGSFRAHMNCAGLIVFDKKLSDAEATEWYNLGSPVDPSGLSFVGNVAGYNKLGTDDALFTALASIGVIDGTISATGASIDTGDAP